MWLYQSFRDVRLQDRTLSCVSFHTALDRGTLQRSQASCKGWAIYKYPKFSELWSLESLYRDLQVSCIYRTFFLFPECITGLETSPFPSPPQKQNQCKSWYLAKKTNEKCILQSSLLCQAFHFRSKTAVYAVSLPPVPAAGCQFAF